MLIKALCDYYDAQNRKTDGGNLPDCFSEQSIHYAIFLTPDGEISGIADLRREVEITLKNGKVKKDLKPLTYVMPKRSQKTCIDFNVAEHRPLYIFGLNYDKGAFTPEDKTDKAKKSHACFTEKSLEFCDDLNSDIAKAFCCFIEKWKPEEQTENPHLLKLGKDYQGSYFCFALDGHPEIMLHNDSELIAKFTALQAESKSDATNENDAVCAIEGERLPIARIHDKISGVKGGNSVGCVLVGVKDNAFESYGKAQSFNSNISEKAMKKYTYALNKLLADKNHKLYFDEMTVLFFAIEENDENWNCQ